MLRVVTVGARLERFEVLCHLGSGGMGSVFRARDPRLERDVAIKVMAQPRDSYADLSEGETIDLRTGARPTTENLLFEARMMARLSHPNVVPVYEVGLIAGAVFVVMEHIEGGDLRDWLTKRRSDDDIIDVFLQAGRGLAAAHAVGIVHRDFKPENVLVGRDGRVRVADFGLSRLSVRPQRRMRRLDQPVGTPRYMAAELWRGEPATPRADVYAFCVALIEAFGLERGDHLDRMLRERDVTPALRSALRAGIAEDPAARPDLQVVLDALAGRSPAAQHWIATAVGAGAIAIGVIAALALATCSPKADRDSCDVSTLVEEP